MTWHVYIIKCRDNTLYTGITNNLKRRIAAHNSGNGCRYTKSRRPVKLIHSEKHPTKSQALKRESYIKSLPRAKKHSLKEEVEAVTAYNQRAEACEDENLKKILLHNAKEEKEHAVMLIEWISQHDKEFEKEAKEYLFSGKADIASLEK